MAFGKTFVLSLLTFIGISFGGWIIGLLLNGEIGDILSHLMDLEELSGALFGPISRYPGYIIGGIDTTTLDTSRTTFGFIDDLLAGSISLGRIISFIFYIVAPLLAAIVAGRIGESKGGVFGAWFLVVGVCMGGALTMTLLAFVIDESLLLITIITFIATAIGNAFFYGAFALLLSKGDFY